LGADINHTNGEANCSGTESGDLWIAKNGSPDTGCLGLIGNGQDRGSRGVLQGDARGRSG